MTQREQIVGTYDLGGESVVVMLRPDTGADYSTRSRRPRDKAHIYLGADYADWYMVVTSLIHEAMEFCFMRLACRWTPGIDYSQDSGNYLFVATHAQHSEVCGRLGYFLAECLPDLERAWKKWKKERKHK